MSSIMEQEKNRKEKLEWKPKNHKCPKCGATIGDDYNQCANCWAGPLPMKEINEMLDNYYRENGGRTFRKY